MGMIREATPEDALGAAVVNAYTWLTTYRGLVPDEMLAARIARVPQQAEQIRGWLAGAGAGLVAEADHTVVGMCLFGPARSGAYPGSGEITALYVLDAFHGQGLGRALFEEAVRRLRAAGYAGMVIHCLCGNPTLGFYRHMGGRVDGRREDCFGGVTLREDVVFYPDLDAVVGEKQGN